ncbi:MAG: hypothetical protein WC499_04110 [Patescibacteria group bacterium]
MATKNKVPEKKSVTPKQLSEKKSIVLEGESKKSKKGFKKIGIIIWIISTIWIVCLINQNRKEAINVFLDSFYTDKITLVDEIRSDSLISLTNFFALSYKEVQVKVINRNGIWLDYSGLSEGIGWCNAREQVRGINIFQKIESVTLDEEAGLIRIELNTNFLLTTILGLLFILIFWIVVVLLLKFLQPTNPEDIFIDIVDYLEGKRWRNRRFFK